MPKRQHSDEDIEAYVNRKMRKIEKKLKRCRSHGQRSYSQDSLKIAREPLGSVPCEEHSSSAVPPRQSTETIETQNTDDPRQLDVPPNSKVNNLLEPLELPASTNVSSDLVATDMATGDEQIVENNSAEETLPEDILEILGEAPIKDKNFGSPLNLNLAVRWEYTATNGLSKEAKKEILTKRNIPENCKNIDAPVLNQEVKAALTDVLKKKDKAIENKQKQIALIIACLGDALSHVLSTDNTNLILIKSLTDAGKLACDLQHTESMIRRSFVCSSIKKEIKYHHYSTKIDSHLFGSQLGDLLKAAKAINKTGAEMKTIASAPGQSKRFTNQTQNLNSRRPPPQPSRQTGVAARRPSMPAPTNRTEYQRPQRRAPQPRPQPSAPYRRSQTYAPHRR